VQRKIFGPKREEMAGDGRGLHSERLYNLYTSPNIIMVIKSRMIRWVGHIAHMGELRYSYKILMRKPEGNGQLGRSRHR
jgi:hypothetical protein